MRKQRTHGCGAGWHTLARLLLQHYRWIVGVSRAHLRRPWHYGAAR